MSDLCNDTSNVTNINISNVSSTSLPQQTDNNTNCSLHHTITLSPTVYFKHRNQAQNQLNQKISIDKVNGQVRCIVLMKMIWSSIDKLIEEGIEAMIGPVSNLKWIMRMSPLSARLVDCVLWCEWVMWRIIIIVNTHMWHQHITNKWLKRWQQ